jgi:hypothetical protein
MREFTGPSETRGISMPADMWVLLEQYKARDGIPVSTQIQRAVVAYVMEKVATRLVDPGVAYETEATDES